MDNSVAGSHYDFGARIYDGRIGKWLSVDPLQSVYPGLNPHNFVANSPLSCVDPDGRLIIFISGLRLMQGAGDQKGYHHNKKSRAGIYSSDKILQGYWRSKKNSFGRKAEIDVGFIKAIGDDNTWYASGSSTWTSQAAQRVNEGKIKAMEFHAMVQSGQIHIDAGETIKIVSHSQGGAHSVGFAEQLASYKT